MNYNIYHFEKILVLFLIFSASTFSQQSSVPSNNIDASPIISADNALNHASTYYWLARYKNSDSGDFLKAKYWYQQALIIIESDSVKDNEKLRSIALKGLEETDIRYDNNYENIHNKYPLFDIITGNNSTYEYYEDGDEAAASRAIEEMLTLIRTSIPREDLQIMTIVISDPKNPPLEDELLFIINNYGHFYSRPSEEILAIVDIEQFNALNNFPNNKQSFTALNKLAAGWQQRYIMIIKLQENDIVEDVYYFGTWAYLYDSQNGTVIKSIYSDGFSEDKRYVNAQKMIMILIALLLAILLPLIFKYTYSFIFRTDRRPIYLYTSLYALITTLAIHYPILFIFKAWAPDPNTLSVMLMNRVWIFSLVFTLALFPPILVYLLGTRIPGIRDRLSDGESITSLAAGTLLGNLTSLALVYITRYSFAGLTYYYSLSIITIIITSLYLGFGISNKFHKGINRDLISIAVYIFAAVLLMLSILKNDHFYTLLSIIVGFVTPVFAISYNKILEYLEKRKEGEISGITYLNQLDKNNYKEILKYPVNYISPFVGKNMVQEVSTFFTELFPKDNSQQENSKNKLRVLLITGPSGCGKTRLANEIAKQVIDQYNIAYNIDPNISDAKNWILFGDCDEMTKEGSGVPFEPFSQAMHSVLGAGRFEPPLKRANKIKAGFEKLGMDEALGAAGLGVLNNILGSGSNTNEVTPATSNEMANIIEQTLLRLAINRPVVFIIDDTQWIDDQTFALFNDLLKNLVTITKTPNIHFIITARENSDKSEKSTNKLIDILKTYGPNKLIQLQTMDESHFIGKDRFEEFLTRGLYFDNYSARQITLFLEKYDVNSVTQVIQTVKQILNNNGIEFQKSQAIIKNDFQLFAMEPPSNAIDQVTQLLDTLEPDEKRIVECAAFIGTEFNATTLSEALNMGRLTTLINLRRLEKKGFINDILDQDDVFQFSSSMILNGLRFITSNVTKNEKSNISQIVREYHYRIASSIEKQFGITDNNMESVDKLEDYLLYKLAKRSMASGDRMVEKSVNYNIIAQNRALKNVHYFESISFGQNVLEILNKMNDSTLNHNLTESFFSTINSMTNTNTYPEKIKKFYKTVSQLLNEKSQKNKSINQLKLKCMYTDSIIHDFSNSYEQEKEPLKNEIKQLLSQTEEIESSPLLKIFGKLSVLRLDNSTDKLQSLDSLYDELEQVVNPENKWFQLRLQSEILEEMIKIELNNYSVEYSKDDHQSTILEEKIAEGIKIKEKINDQEGLCQMFIFKGDYMLKNNNNSIAEKSYQKALNIAKVVGSMDYASDSHTGLGKILSDKGKYDEALTKFTKAMVESKIDDNIPNQYASLIGVFSVAKELKDKNIVVEFSDETVAIFQKDKSKGVQYNQLISALKECSDFAPQITNLIP